MDNNKSIFINSTGCNNWILNIIADDILHELSLLGYNVRKGSYDEYNGEEIAYHMWWRIALPYSRAKVNSVFITHTDDVMKEHDLHSMRNKFDSYITMSEEDAQFLVELGFDRKKVFGVNLPVRNNYIKPISLGIFSSCYPDNRKNEKWLLEYCQDNQLSKLANFVFIGSGWGDFVQELISMGCSIEWHCVSRDLPNEYFFQQLKLLNVDYYLYMGMDGGAMGTYDAYAMGAQLCISDDGYHKGIPDIDLKFETKEKFFQVLNSILSKQKRKIDFYSENSVKRYGNTLLEIWTNTQTKCNQSEITNEASAFHSVLEKRRYNYFNCWNFARIRQSISSFIKRKRSIIK